MFSTSFHLRLLRARGQLNSFSCTETRVQSHKAARMEGWSHSNCKASNNLFFKQMLLCNLQHRKQQQLPVSTEQVNTLIKQKTAGHHHWNSDFLTSTMKISPDQSPYSYPLIAKLVVCFKKLADLLSPGEKFSLLYSTSSQKNELHITPTLGKNPSLAKAIQKNTAFWKRTMMKLGFLSVWECSAVTRIPKRYLKGKQRQTEFREEYSGGGGNHTQVKYKIHNTW